MDKRTKIGLIVLIILFAILIILSSFLQSQRLARAEKEMGGNVSITKPLEIQTSEQTRALPAIVRKITAIETGDIRRR